MGAVTINVAIELEGGSAHDLAKAERLVEGMPEIFQAMVAERHAQDLQWGGAAHDDTHAPIDWEALLDEHVGRLTRVEGTHFVSAPDYRRRLVKVGALVVAALQSHDRRQAAEQEGRADA